MPQTWRPISGGDVDSLKRCLVQLRDLFCASLGPKGRFKFLVGSAEGAPTQCTSKSTRIISFLRGLFIIHQSSALDQIIILYFLIISAEVLFVHKWYISTELQELLFYNISCLHFQIVWIARTLYRPM